MPDERGNSNPKEEIPNLSESTRHWFADRDVDTLLYKINRRPPIAGETLFRPPENILDHLKEVLAVPAVAVTGTRFRREWRIGNKVFDDSAGSLTGMVGWTRSTAALASVWDEGRQDWVDRVVPGDASAVAPFAFVADGRFLGVLRHSSFSEIALADVFRQILNRGERSRREPATDWDVEPVGDQQEFYQWVAATDSIQNVEFVFKRPNPDAESSFEELFARMDAMEARQIRESIRALDEVRGLNKQALTTERWNAMFIAAAMAAYGYVIGWGVTRGRRVRYDQRRHAAREHLENVPASWDGATEEVLAAVRRAVGRRRRDE